MNNKFDKYLFGYRFFNVESESMEPDLPVGSMLFVKKALPEKIEIGDDVTFYMGGSGKDSYLTHRVTGISVNDEGQFLFVTKGINNPVPDRDAKKEGMVVGKVVYCIPKMGNRLIFINKHIFISSITILFPWAVIFGIMYYKGIKKSRKLKSYTFIDLNDF
ncbi:MAG: signal peptidase I [Oscillospiraceae bacterium]|nr:signal peptidase I [Oscillospiraceae bacterium]